MLRSLGCAVLAFLPVQGANLVEAVEVGPDKPVAFTEVEIRGVYVGPRQPDGSTRLIIHRKAAGSPPGVHFVNGKRLTVHEPGPGYGLVIGDVRIEDGASLEVYSGSFDLDAGANDARFLAACRSSGAKPFRIEAARIERQTNVLLDTLARQVGHSSPADWKPYVEILLALGDAAHADVLNSYLRGKPGAGLVERIGAGIHDDVAKRWKDLTYKQKWKLLQLDNCVGRAEAIPFVLGELNSKKRLTRFGAISWIERNRAAEAKPRLMQMLTSEQSTLRWDILAALTSIGGEDVVDVLIDLLAADSWAAKGKYAVHPPGPTLPWWPDERHKIMQGLRKLQDKRSAPVLLKILQEKKEGEAWLALFAIPLLGELGYQEAIPTLKAILALDDASLLPPDAPAHVRQSRDWEVRRHTARALFQLGAPSGRGLLARELTVVDVGRRRFAAETYARFGEKCDIPALAGCLEDENDQVRRWACFGLERITGIANRAIGRAESSEQDVPAWLKWWETHRNEYEKP